MLIQRDLEQKLRNIGWQAGDPSFWDYYKNKQPQIAIVAPPLDSIPSKNGNAIYVLVEKLAQHISVPVIVLSKWLVGVDCSKSPIINKIIYYKLNSIIDPLMYKFLPYRLRKKIWGSSIANVNQYFRSAGRACDLLNIKLAILEDVTQGVINFSKQCNSLIILHQHSISPLGLTAEEWRQTLEQLNEIIFVSQKTLNQVEQKFGSIPIRKNVIYNGVDLSRFDPVRWRDKVNKIREMLKIPSFNKVLLYVGRLAPQKGVLEAIKAFKLANFSNVTFVIVGDTSGSSLTSDISYVTKLKKEVANLESQIILVGSVSQEEIPAWYLMADALVVPSIGEEGLPKVITESLAMGCPVIATDRGGNWELIRNEENGWYLKDARNIEEFSNLLVKIFTDEEQLRYKKQMILELDRCNMDEQKMVLEFTKIIHRTIGIQKEV